MRRWLPLVVALALVAAACSAGTVETSFSVIATDDSVPATTAPPNVVPTTSPPESTERTLTPPLVSVEVLGAGLIASQPGSGGMAGWGCSPGSDDLPDGAWFGWVDRADPDSVTFDLACLEPGEVPVAINESRRLRDLPVDPSAVVFTSDGTVIAYDEWEPTDEPTWLFIRDGRVFEIAYLWIDVSVATGATWAPAHVVPPFGWGCCDQPDTGQPSPSEPWPASGLPATDGIYAVSPIFDQAAGELVLTIRRYVPCGPTTCAPDPPPDGLAVERGDAIVRPVGLDADLTVQIIALTGPDAAEGVSGMQGSGVAFADLLDDMQAAWDANVDPMLARGMTLEEARAELLARGKAMPEFPFGPAESPGVVDDGPLVYRGPLGLQLTVWAGPAELAWPALLQIENGRPILILHAAMIAG